MINRRPINPIFGEVKRYELPPPSPSEPTPVEPPDPELTPPFFFSKIPELHTLAKAVGLGSEWTWQYPGEINGQPHEQICRHLYNSLLKQQCPDCHEQVPTYIDIARLTAGPHCPQCNGHQHKPESISYSYLQYELERKPEHKPEPIISDWQGFIADDPKLADESLWEPGHLFHLGAPMGSGKTTLFCHRAREAAESGALSLIVVPRVSLAKSVRTDLITDTGLGWGLFHEGHKGEIGNYGAVCTLGWLPRLLKKMIKDYPSRPIRIFIDEIDFASSLLLADIFKRLSQEIKDALRARKDTIGIVTAGQTVTTLTLEAIAKELDCDLKGYYLSPRPADRPATLHIVDTVDVEQGKNRIVQAVIDQAKNVLASGKKCYIFGDERRSAQIIAAHFGDKALLYDAYNKKSPDIAEFHRLTQLPEDKMVLIATTAVDVGVSLFDENAETIVFCVENPRFTNGLSSSVQQCLRNRTKPPLSIYLMKYQNALPLAPKQSIDFQTKHAEQKLADDETTPEGLIEQLGISDAMRSLEADQPETFFKHHLHQADYQVQMQRIDWETVDFEQVQTIRKQIKDVENEQVKAMAQELLCPEQMLTENEIRNKDWEQLQPTPIIQRAHERANALLRAAGWDGNVERFVDEGNEIATDPMQAFKDASVTDEMWKAARAALQADLNPDKITGWKKGYLTTHHKSVVFNEFEESREFEIHHRSDAIFIGSLGKALLEKLPRHPTTMEAIGTALIDAAQETFGIDRLSALMKNGSVLPTIANRVRFVNLGTDTMPTEAHFAFVKWFISEYYPARIAKAGDLYQLAAPQDTEQVEAFVRLMQCRVKADDDGIDPEPENGDLTPPPASDPRASDKALVIQMRRNGCSYRKIAKDCSISISTAHAWCNDDSESSSRSANFLGTPYIENSPNAPSLPESPQNRTTTASEADSLNVGLMSDQTSDKADQTLRSDILRMLTYGEKTTGEILKAIEGKRTSIMDELKRLVDAGEIVKVKRGVYDLPSHTLEGPTADDLRKLPPVVWDLKENEEATAVLNLYFRQFLATGERVFLSNYRSLYLAFWWLSRGTASHETIEHAVNDIDRLFEDAHRFDPELKHPLRYVYRLWLVSRSPPVMPSRPCLHRAKKTPSPPCQKTSNSVKYRKVKQGETPCQKRKRSQTSNLS